MLNPAGESSAREQRRLVSIVFCDLVGSTSLSGRLDPEVLRSVTLRYFDLMRACVEAHDGVVEKFIGDAVMAAFGVPHLHEDDPRRAITAARDMRSALEDFNAELSAGLGIRLDVRIGVNTGEVVTNPDTSAGHGFVSGEAVNVAARLEQSAAPGQILVGARTVQAAGGAAVVEPAGRLELRGKAEPVTAYVLVDVRSDDPELVRRFDVPFVGRTAERGELSLILDRVVRQGTGQLMTVYGDAGIGKTRFVRTWLAGRDDVRTGTGRCRPYGTAGTLAPLAEMIGRLIDPADTPPVLADGLLRDGTPNPSVAETVAAVSDLLGTLGPVVLVLDDCHWATPALLDVIEELVDRATLDPVLFLCLARPDLLDSRPGWGGGRLNAGALVLPPLTDADSGAMAAGLVEVGAHTGAGGPIGEAVRRAEGNPLHLEQLVTALLQDGGQEQLPTSVHALLGARIGALGPLERAVLDRAAVIGRDFDADTVRRLDVDDADPRPALQALTRRRLIEPTRRPDTRGAFRFSSTLIQEVAYVGMAKRVRAEHHEHLADLADRTSAGNTAVSAGHLEAAHRYRVELGSFGPKVSDLRLRAAAALTAAGTNALNRTDLVWAADLLGRAVVVYRPGEPGRADAVRRFGEVLLALGRVDEGITLLRDVLADGGLDPVTAAHARLLLSGYGSGPTPADAARAALPVFTAAGDRLGLARATIRLAQEQQFEGRHERAGALLGDGLAEAVAAGAEAERAAALGAIGVSLWLGPTPIGAAVERCTAFLAEHSEGRPAVEATLSCPLAVLLAIQGRTETAREHLDHAARVARGLGFAEAEAYLPLFGAQVDRLAGANAAAEDRLGRALATAHTIGVPALAEAAGRDLARLMIERCGWAEAAGLLGPAAPGLPPDLPPAEAADDAGLRARLAAATIGPQGAEAALAWADHAAAAAGRTDSPLSRGMADLDRAHTLLALDRAEEAQSAADSAAGWFARKEHPAGLAWCAAVTQGGLA